VSDERRRVTAVYERDEDGVWIVALEEEPRAHSFGRTLERARANIEDVASLWFDGELEVLDEVILPKGARDEVDEANAVRAELRSLEAVLRTCSTSAAHRLAKENISRRDIGNLLGISHQRVQQLLVGS